MALPQALQYMKVPSVTRIRQWRRKCFRTAGGRAANLKRTWLWAPYYLHQSRQALYPYV